MASRSWWRPSLAGRRPCRMVIIDEIDLNVDSMLKHVSLCWTVNFTFLGKRCKFYTALPFLLGSTIRDCRLLRPKPTPVERKMESDWSAKLRNFRSCISSSLAAVFQNNSVRNWKKIKWQAAREATNLRRIKYCKFWLFSYKSDHNPALCCYGCFFMLICTLLWRCRLFSVKRQKITTINTCSVYCFLILETVQLYTFLRSY